VTLVARPVSVQWESLGTYAYLAAAPEHLDRAHAVALEVLGAVDRTCSRFRADSDLSRANARPGGWVAVDPLLVAALGVAVGAAEATGGLVTPCLGRNLVSLGYDATLGVVHARRSPVRRRLEPPPRATAWQEIRTDPDGAVRVPTGCSLDLGATAKAWASDLVAGSIADRLGCAALVSLGGDVRVVPGEDGPAQWSVRVTERLGDADGQTVWLDGGGLATSSTTARHWQGPSGACHHLLDPRTGLPTDGYWRTVTATGPTCAAANTASTAAVVLGPDAPDWLARRQVAARLVAADGTVTRSDGWPAPDPVGEGRP
jgi:thiamine biosynthesis lipoprotein